MQYPGLCLEQVCLLKYLPCHTCVSWIQSCGIILVPVHTSWSYPRRCPVTPRTGGAALAAGTAPLPHDPRDRQTATLPRRLSSTCTPGADPAQGQARDLLQSRKGALPGDRERRAPRILFFPPLRLLPANSQPIYAK